MNKNNMLFFCIVSYFCCWNVVAEGIVVGMNKDRLDINHGAGNSLSPGYGVSNYFTLTSASISTVNTAVRPVDKGINFKICMIRDVLHIHLRGIVSNKASQLSVVLYTVNGRKVFERTSQVNQMKDVVVLHCQSIAPSLYIVEVKMQGLKVVRTVVITN